MQAMPVELPSQSSVEVPSGLITDLLRGGYHSILTSNHAVQDLLVSRIEEEFASADVYGHNIFRIKLHYINTVEDAADDIWEQIYRQLMTRNGDKAIFSRRRKSVRSFSELQSALSVILHRGVEYLVLIIEDIELCDIDVGKLILAFLRTLRESYPHRVGCLIAGRMSPYELSLGDGSPFFLSHSVQVPKWSINEINHEIEDALHGVELLISADALDLLIVECGGDWELHRLVLGSCIDGMSSNDEIGYKMINDALQEMHAESKIITDRINEISRLVIHYGELRSVIVLLLSDHRISSATMSSCGLLPGISERGGFYEIDGKVNRRIYRAFSDEIDIESMDDKYLMNYMVTESTSLAAEIRDAKLARRKARTMLFTLGLLWTVFTCFLFTAGYTKSSGAALVIGVGSVGLCIIVSVIVMAWYYNEMIRGMEHMKMNNEKMLLRAQGK